VTNDRWDALLRELCAARAGSRHLHP